MTELVKHGIDVYVSERIGREKYSRHYPDRLDESEGEGLCSFILDRMHQYEPIEETLERESVDREDVIRVQKTWVIDGECEIECAPMVPYKSWADYYVFFNEDGEHSLDISIFREHEEGVRNLGYELDEEVFGFAVPFGKYQIDKEGRIRIAHEYPDAFGLNQDWFEMHPGEKDLLRVLKIPQEWVHSITANG